MDACNPRFAGCQGILEVRRMRAIDGEVGRRGRRVHSFYGITQRLSAWQSAVCFHSERNDHGQSHTAVLPIEMPRASAEVVMVTAASISTPPAASAAA